jgi:hypothetical protein
MARFDKKEFLDKLNEENKELLKNIESKLMPLSKEKLNYKPSKKAWSINEIFQHLILAETLYLKQIREIRENWKDSTRTSYQSTVFGDFFTGLMEPKADKKAYKIPAPKLLDPANKRDWKDKDPHEVIISYMKIHEEIRDAIKEGKIKDIEGVKLRTAVPLMKLQIGDAFRVITEHAKRHYLQALKNI